MAVYTSGEYFQVSVLTVSDQIKGGSYVTKFNGVHEKLVMRKTQNEFV
jgi:hypothetical protein